ncbi:aspartate aminotransferase family protein [Cloacibacillus evryensis]|nr:aminotransferase class III-fold pyridoxal phosphate-dependent enzyme [Cloacibacillus evryensis]MCQ4764237.1 aminotransferase class III-fold pyridoxal phosphate-dependent enzyme [Cloacibacillus evryensis]MEA5034317.1 aminotransferase class III-fold pyridoxal phosphate-dependent enzyme [Cloacibacillus evryensis]
MAANNAPRNNVFYRTQTWRYPKIVKGEGVFLYGENGKRYLDACSGSAVANIGHGNAEIADYARGQMARIAFTHLSRWTVDTIEACAEKLASWTPGDLDHVYFVSGGSEAVETALKMARQYFIERDGSSSKWKVISKWNGFHGNTLGALSVTGISGRKKVFDPILLQFPKIPQFYHYRNPWGCGTLMETSVKAAEALESEILRQGPENVMAFISEPVVGSACPGIHPAPVYFQMVRSICDKYDVLWIDDEVMAGCGRTGKKMAVEHFGGAIPDILCTAKGMSCGYTPIGAAVASEKVFNAIMIDGSGSFHHGHTYAGNPLSTGIACKVMEIIEREHYIDNAAVQGEYLLAKLEELYKYPIVGDVRGKGLMCGIEFVRDKTTKEPFETKQNIKGKITEYCLERGIVPYPGGGSADGVRGDHIQITPPITISREEVDILISALDAAIKQVCDELR